MSQTLAIFHDAYRALRARKMFWIVLILSSLVVASFACIGVNDKGLTLLAWDLHVGPTATEMPPGVLYKFMFASFGVDFWLTWVAAILALISTAGIFPSFVAKGAINLVVSRPISRLRLFLTQYAAGLLFVTLQIAAFTVASFLAIGLRGGLWEPGLFLAVPLVVCFFSYLFCVCVLLGLLTRSTVAALLLTLLFWFLVFILHSAETGLLMAKAMAEHERNAAREAAAETRPGTRPSSSPAASQPNLPPRGGDESDQDRTARYLSTAHRVIYGVKTVLPKTAETIDLLKRALIATADLPKTGDGSDRTVSMRAAMELARELRSRSPWWIVGTSLAFEAVILALASWVFCRRDF